jgi:hypothetical protein
MWPQLLLCYVIPGLLVYYNDKNILSMHTTGMDSYNWAPKCASLFTTQHHLITLFNLTCQIKGEDVDNPFGCLRVQCNE